MIFNIAECFLIYEMMNKRTVKISAKFTDFRRSKYDLEIRIELRLFQQDNLVRKKWRWKPEEFTIGHRIFG